MSLSAGADPEFLENYFYSIGVCASVIFVVACSEEPSGTRDHSLHLFIYIPTTRPFRCAKVYKWCIILFNR